MKIFNFDNIPQPIAILNGTEGLSGPEEDIFRSATNQGIEIHLIEELFTHPERLAQLITLGIKTIAIQTTGQNGDGIRTALQAFHKLNFIPEAIILIFEDYFWCEARDFQEQHPNTKIFSTNLFGQSFDTLEFS